MRVIICGINFRPEPTGIGKYTGEMVDWLLKEGVSVDVIVGVPHYPHWVVPEEFGGPRYYCEYRPGLRLIRCPVLLLGKGGLVSRLVLQASFLLSSLPVLIWFSISRPNLIWTVAPAFASSLSVSLISSLFRIPSWIHIQDLEIDAAFDTGVIRSRGVRGILRRLESFVLKSFDVVSTISRSMKIKLSEKGVVGSRLVLFPNWVDLEFVRPISGADDFRRELGISSDAIVVLFSGTMSAKQGLRIVPEVSSRISERLPQVVFLICGDGVVKSDLVERCQDCSNVKFIPLQPQTRVPELLGMADMHLLPQERDVADLVMPSKLTAMLASGRPIVATVLPGTEIAEVISCCGLISDPGNVDGLVDNIVYLAENEDVRREFGMRARSFAEKHLSLDAILQAALRTMKLIGRESAS